MKVEILSENIVKFISVIHKAVPTHTQIPVLSNILLVANSHGFFMSATDLELGVQIKIPAKIEEEGSITVPGKQFIEIINSLSAGKIILAQLKETLSIASAEFKITLQTIAPEEFPSLFEEKGEKIYSFTPTEFRTIFTKIIFAASIDEARPQLTGIYITQKDESIHFVATDGYRLSLKKVAKNSALGDAEGIIISSKLITEALTLKDEGVIDMYVYHKNNQVIIESKHVTLVGRLIEGSFPNYEKVIPETHTTKVTLNKDEFTHVIRLSSVLARDNSNIVKLTVDKNAVTIFSRSQSVGEGEVHLDVLQEGEKNEISFNAKYLLDLLKNIEEKEVIMELANALEPAAFKTEKDPNFLHIIMPVRVQD